jgi:hypothetical protein
MENNVENDVWYRSKWFFWFMVVIAPHVAIVLLFVFKHYENHKGLRKGILLYTVGR